MADLLKVSSNPHVRSKVNTASIMFAVVIALLPATALVFIISDSGRSGSFLPVWHRRS